MASTAGLAPATSTFARWRSDRTELRGQLALGQHGIRDRTRSLQAGSKSRLRGCSGLTDRLRMVNEWSPGLVSRQRLLVFSEALICLSYPGCLRTAKTGRPGT